MDSKAWYRSWFNSPYYHILYKNRDVVEAANFIDRLLKYLNPNPSAQFLDLACGKGRHSIYINQKGFDVRGVDLSPENIRQANTSENETLHFNVHDMRLPYLPESFDYVLNLFTSFGYFDSIEENRKVLTAAHHNLIPKGILLIDFLNVNRVMQKLVKDETQEIDGISFRISRNIVDGMIEKKIRVEDNGKTIQFQERVKALNRQDFIGMLGLSNFEILDTFGNYNLEKFDELDSERLIIIARKIG